LHAERDWNKNENYFWRTEYKLKFKIEIIFWTKISLSETTAIASVSCYKYSVKTFT